ncbi:hypothetical protein RHSIM_Rhsim02G0014100 [Rhododendron simsii]|uniref:Acyl carrier protein n=1 Tax=Rhododendron simsii TaxID=118357 RepID=A0A834HAJ3_RHOSS|nr:hypothetical protein RHSIM_Rhsim02G0014100 [Rhododendron simsii]
MASVTGLSIPMTSFAGSLKQNQVPMRISSLNSASLCLPSLRMRPARFQISCAELLGNALIGNRDSLLGESRDLFLKLQLCVLGICNDIANDEDCDLFEQAKPETVDKVCEIVRKQLALTADTAVTGDSKFTALGADSLDTVEIVMGLEEAFGISVEEENAQSIATVHDAAEMIDKIIEAKV